MIIAISGRTGSGKDTLGKELAKRLGYPVVSPTFKDLAAREGISLMEFQKKAMDDPNIDRKFDDVLKEQVAATNGRCVVTTWLGPWMINADLRVYVSVADDVRAERVAKRDGMSVPEAKKHLFARDKQNHERYMKVYGIDIFDISKFDLKLDSGKMNPEQLADAVMAFAKKKKLV
ncbi:MAG: cytidylate kinase family protein [Desulfobulbaceae bacterium]|nr:cytidylate kinase family protein [Desulfobulbaceae bacterium]